MYTSLLLVIFYFVTVHCMTIGNNLDKKFKSIESNFTNLRNRYQQLKNELEKLKGSSNKSSVCFPCVPTNVIVKTGEKQICDCTNQSPQKDCLEFLVLGIKVDGIYKLLLGNSNIVNVFCDQTTSGGGWTVFQRRVDGSIDFYRNWKEFRVGFGQIDKEFWLGNDNIYDLTKPSNGPQKSTLLINMKMKINDTKLWAKYSSFDIGDESSKFVLHLSGFSGNVKNRMNYNNNMKFTTYDQDNDSWAYNCAKDEGKKSSWWSSACSLTYLNAEYVKMNWYYGDGLLTFSEMKVRRNV